MMDCKSTLTGKKRQGFLWVALFLMALVKVAKAEPGGPNVPAVDPGDRPGGPVMHAGGPEGPGPEIEPLNPKLLRELDLTPEQQKKFKEAHLTVQKRKIQLQSEKAISELDLKNALTSYPVNKGEAMKAGEKVAEADRKLTLLKVESWSQFQAGLSAEQHHKLMDIQADLHSRRQAWREEFKNQRRENKREEKREERSELKHKGRPDR